MVERFVENKGKSYSSIGELKLALLECEELYETGTIGGIDKSHNKYRQVMEMVLKKIASGSCASPPTWCKNLLSTGTKIGYIDD